MDISPSGSDRLNSSTSKMKYSFSKSERFQMKRYETPSPNKFYQLPEIKSKRATGFGYGNKMDISRQNFNTPSPNAYKLSSSFDGTKYKGITMGEGRQKCQVGDMFHQNFKKPGPSEYKVQKMKKSISFSMSYRHKDLTDKWIKSVPGPGAYENIKVTDQNVKSNLSKHISAPSTRFGRQQRLTEAQIYDPKTPGSNLYNISTQIAKKFNQKGGNRFSRSLRPSISNTNPVPGPGSYNRISDFA